MKCKAANFDKEAMEAKFSKMLKQFEYTLDISDVLKIAIEMNWQKRNELLVKERQAKSEQLNKFKTKQIAIIDQNTKGIIPDELAKELIDKLASDIQRLQGELTNYKPQEDYVEEIV